MQQRSEILLLESAGRGLHVFTDRVVRWVAQSGFSDGLLGREFIFTSTVLRRSGARS